MSFLAPVGLLIRGGSTGLLSRKVLPSTSKCFFVQALLFVHCSRQQPSKYVVATAHIAASKTGQ